MTAERPGGRLEDEIREQPAVIAHLLDDGRAASDAVAADLRRAAPAFLVVVARGSSDNAARYAQYLFGARNRLVVALASPSLHTIYRRPPSLRGGAVLALSQSGQSPDVVAVVEDARRQGAPAIALTNDASSPLARAATHVLPLRAGSERAVAASKSYTAELVALAQLSASLEADPRRRRELAALPGAVAAALAEGAPFAEQAALPPGSARLAVLGRGYNHATAHEIALKLKEACYLPAEAASWADFRHGPLAIVERDFPALVVAPSGEMAGDAVALLELLDGRGARLYVISDREDLLDRARVRFPLPRPVPEWLSPIVAVVPGQLWALALARARGIDPDAPRGLAKVTRTT